MRESDLADLRRQIAYVPQEPYLFQGSIAENIRMGRLDVTEKEIREAAMQAHAHDFIMEFPEGYDTTVGERGNNLSGGQRQRVALARAIVKQSDFFLLDEPLSNLDAQLRGHARKELVKLHEMYGQTMIYVTHDQIEAMTVGQRIAVINNGKIQMLDTPHMVYHRPANIFVAKFIGSPSMNIFDAPMAGNQMKMNGVDLTLSDRWMKQIARHHSEVKTGVRPEDVTLQAEPGEGCIPVTVQYHEDYGSRVGYYFTVNGTDVISIMREDILQGRSQAYWKVDQHTLHFFDKETEANIGYPEE